jgi:2-C-methyl-D-erythritol 4-phosphate cytidylyltransferase
MDHCLEEIVEKYRYQKVSQIVPGGKRRQDSVRNGIEALSRDVDVVVIHDGVRPFVTREMIEESIHTAFKFEAALVAMPVKDTIKMVHADGTVFKTLDRETLWQIRPSNLSGQPDQKLIAGQQKRVLSERMMLLSLNG